jgi:hypothetical protein
VWAHAKEKGTYDEQAKTWKADAATKKIVGKDVFVYRDVSGCFHCEEP